MKSKSTERVITPICEGPLEGVVEGSQCMWIPGVGNVPFSELHKYIKMEKSDEK